LVNASVAAFATIGRVAELDEVENTDKDKIISDLTLLEIAKNKMF
jgi:hypothetical protein